jgi:uncharacterized membrane protein
MSARGTLGFGSGESEEIAMAVDVSAEVLIEWPRAEVAAFVMDPANDPVWIGGIRSARALEGWPIAVGSRVERTASFLGRRIDYVNEVVELEPGTTLHMRSVRSPFPMEITYSFADAPDGTRAAIRVQGEATRFYRLAAPVLGAAVRRSVSGDLRRLKVLLEGRVAAPGTGAPAR